MEVEKVVIPSESSLNRLVPCGVRDTHFLKYSPDFLKKRRFAVKRTASDSFVREVREALKTEDFRQIKKCTRRGSKKLSVMYVNAHGRNNLLRLWDPGNIVKHGVSFLSETWLTEPKSQPIFPSKKSFVQHATKSGGRGRPSGGIEANVTPALEPTLIFKSEMILGITLKGITIGGCYFKPSLEVDDITNELSNFLNLVEVQEKVMLIGDFNLKPGSFAFDEVCCFLRQFNVVLRSDTRKDTFHHAAGGSCIDHIFASEALDVEGTMVHDVCVSDHKPISALVRIPCRSPKTISSETSTRIDLELVAQRLKAVNNSELSPKTLSEVFRPQRLPCPGKDRAKKKGLTLTPLVRGLRNRAMSLLRRVKSGDQMYKEYAIARSAYHKALRHCEMDSKLREVEKFLRDSSDGDMTQLYRKARTGPLGAMVDLNTFLAHSKALYQRYGQPVCPCPPIPSDDDHFLLSAVSKEEVEFSLTRQKSKACGLRGYSPWHLKSLGAQLLGPLSLIFTSCLKNANFPQVWLNSTLFFLHKKGPRSDPNNFRSIAIQDPFMKLFTSILNRRLGEYVDQNNILPECQFGFTNGKSTVGAATILKEVVSERLAQKQRTYAAFIDFSKAFDLVNRTKLLNKLLQVRIPLLFVHLLHYLVQNTTLYLKAGTRLSSGFQSNNGVLQGDPCSPLLFNLFLSDLPSFLVHDGVIWQDKRALQFLMYADDLCLLAHSADDLQNALNKLQNYCELNDLEVNIKKSKILVFHKGRLPPCNFFYGSNELERVNEFSYLGVKFSSQLSFSAHLREVNVKARARIGFLFPNLSIRDLPSTLMIRIFNTFVLPMYEYALPVWITGTISTSTWESLNSVFSKYLKRYLGIPFSSNNAITHHLTQTYPLDTVLKNLSINRTSCIKLGTNFRGLRITLFDDLPPPSVPNLVPMIPSTFWRSRAIQALPMNASYRRRMAREALDSDHHLGCSRKEFHILPTDNCTCTVCGEYLHHYHVLYNLCDHTDV